MTTYKLSANLTLDVHGTKAFLTDGRNIIALGEIEEFKESLEIMNEDEETEAEMSDEEVYYNAIEERGYARRAYGE